MNYSNSLTTSYKCGFIHSACIDGHEVIRAQVDKYAYVVQVRSLRSAKTLITKHYNKLNGKEQVK